MKPEVSVILPAYNSERYINKAIQSLLQQTYRNFEVILVDDGSTDSTASIAANLADNRFKIVRKSQNQGVAAARNCALKMAKGNWIALLDSDDWYAPERLQKLLDIAQSYDADLVADDLFLIGDRARAPWSTLFTENKYDRNSINSLDTVGFIETDRPSNNICQRNWSLGYTKPLIKRQFLLDYNIQYDETLKVGEDFVFYLQCLINGGRFFLVSQPYYYYRNRAASLSIRPWSEYLNESCRIVSNLIETEELIRSNPTLVMALSKNLVVLEKRISYYRAVKSIEDRNFWQSCKTLFGEPDLVIYLTIKSIDLCQQKLKRLISDNIEIITVSID
jgi:succinoglycan biosynthesis protein ExoO